MEFGVDEERQGGGQRHLWKKCRHGGRRRLKMSLRLSGDKGVLGEKRAWRRIGVLNLSLMSVARIEGEESKYMCSLRRPLIVKPSTVNEISI